MINPFATESVSFETPVAMLEACHERIRHYSTLLVKLAVHLDRHGVDSEAINAAQAVLRYFDVAAPLHHADEEQDLFPALLTHGGDGLSEKIRALEAEHVELDALWAELRSKLGLIVSGAPAVLSREEARHFFTRYFAHAAREETEIYPYADTLLDNATLADIGRRMASRRGG
jgi:hemerythrin-like domain-containing protein